MSDFQSIVRDNNLGKSLKELKELIKIKKKTLQENQAQKHTFL